ncbi:MAG: ATP-binding protein [bacterium]|nr:ATP-binding protein [bacterium]
MERILAIGGIIVGGLLILLLVVTFINIGRKPKTDEPEPKKEKKKHKITQNDATQSAIILDAIEDGVIMIGPDKVITTYNPGAEQITGWDADEAIGLEISSVLKLVDPKGNKYSTSEHPMYKIFSKQSAIRDNKAVLLTKSGKTAALHISVSPLYNDNQEISGAVAVFRDVSKERSQENQRADFISTASHEMRTPVAAIEGYLALAMNPNISQIDEKAKSYLEKAHASTQHLGQLFQDLLTSAKAEDGRLSSHPVVVELGELMEEITEDLKFGAQKKGLQVEFIVGASNLVDASSHNKEVRPLYYAYGDADRLREVITNIFDNAVKYTEEGKISIGLTGDEHVIQFYIQDTGAGIPPEDLGHLFQKFYRVDNSATRTIGGTGLGLFISKKIIELYEGKIWAESELGKGSIFYVNLPRLDSAQAEQMKRQAETNPGQAPVKPVRI